MSHLTADEVKHHVKVYLRVFFALAALTVLTVGVSYMHLPLVLGIVIALAIASVKVSLVAAFFMHLATERKIIFFILILAVLFFLALLLFPILAKP